MNISESTDWLNEEIRKNTKIGREKDTQWIASVLCWKLEKDNIN